jgi:hypothetical protein
MLGATRHALVVVTMLACAATGGLGQPAAPATVALNFCWTAGQRALVTTAASRAQSGKPSRSGTVHYTVQVLAQGEHLRIQPLDPKADLSGATTSVGSSVQAELDQRLAELLPDYLVTKAGAFAGIVDLPAYQKRLRDFIDRSLPPNVDRAAVAKGLDMVTSEAFLNARVAQEWNVLVAAWVGGRLPLGVENVKQNQMPSNLGKPLNVTHTFVARRMVPCRRGEVERQCVELELRSVPDPEAVKATVGSTLAALGRPMPPSASVKSFVVEDRVRLVTEPECLIPHEYVKSKVISAVVAADGKEETIERIDRSEASYRYP